MKRLIQLKLKILTQLVLKKYKPEVIGITGSVGKSLAKEAVYTVLKRKFLARRSPEITDNILRVILTVLGVPAPQSFWQIIKTCFKGIKLVLVKDQNYPQILILEMGADQPGDIKYLTQMVRPKIGVITTICETHLENHGSVQKIAKEKSLILTELKKEDWAVFNRDDEIVCSFQARTRAQALSFGFGENAELRALEIHSKWQAGTQFKLSYQGSTVPVLLAGALGKDQVYAALIGAAIGIIHSLNLLEIAEGLKNYQSPPGRMKLINGIKNTLIIDDSYGASFLDMENAVRVLCDFELREEFSHRREKFAVLGDIEGLGSLTEEKHQEIGKKVVELGIDNLITVGEKARSIARSARGAGLRENQIFEFPEAEEAGKFIQNRLEQGDLVLIKGGAKMKMEKIVKELMAEPLRARELLVRQEEIEI